MVKTAATLVLLVHGAWADGSSWSKVIPRLEDAGVQAQAVQLPLTSLADDEATVRRAIALAPGPIVLVGHSYGGVVITETGTDPKVAGLVYISAFAPKEGESAGSLGKDAPASPVGTQITSDTQGFLKLTREGVFDDFAQDLLPEEKSVLFAAEGPTAMQVLGTAVSVAAWHDKPSWYLVARNDRTINPDLERQMAARMGAKTVEVESSHVAMLARPDEVTRLILEAVRQ